MTKGNMREEISPSSPRRICLPKETFKRKRNQSRERQKEIFNQLQSLVDALKASMSELGKMCSVGPVQTPDQLWVLEPLNSPEWEHEEEEEEEEEESAGFFNSPEPDKSAPEDRRLPPIVIASGEVESEIESSSSSVVDEQEVQSEAENEQRKSALEELEALRCGDLVAVLSQDKQLCYGRVWPLTGAAVQVTWLEGDECSLRRSWRSGSLDRSAILAVVKPVVRTWQLVQSTYETTASNPKKSARAGDFVVCQARCHGKVYEEADGRLFIRWLHEVNEGGVDVFYLPKKKQREEGDRTELCRANVLRVVGMEESVWKLPKREILKVLHRLAARQASVQQQ